jgi:protein tyrosine kinase modulator
MDIRHLLVILRARRRLIFAVFLVVVATGSLLTVVLPRSYTASVALVIDAKSANNLLGAMLPPQMLSGYLATQLDVITSRRVTERAAVRPELARDPQLVAQWREASDGDLDFVAWLGGELQRALEVTPARDSNMVTISYSCPVAERCARIANAVADAYIDTNLEMRVTPARQSAGWFDERTRGMRQTLETAQRKLSDYQREHGIIASDERLDVETARLDELSRQLVAVQAEHSTSRSRRGQSGNGDEMPEVVQSPLISGLKGELARREAERDQLASRYGRNHPEIVRLADEIASLQRRLTLETRRIVGSVDNVDRVNAAREAELKAALAAQKAQVLRLKALRDEAAVLQRDVENAQKAHDLVTGRLAETSLEGQAQQTNVFVLAPATAPRLPSSPRRLLIVALSMVLGSLLGVGLALGLEMARRRVRSVVDVVEALEIPVLAVLPRALLPPPR